MAKLESQFRVYYTPKSLFFGKIKIGYYRLPDRLLTYLCSVFVRKLNKYSVIDSFILTIYPS